MDKDVIVAPMQEVESISQEEISKLLNDGWLPFWDRKISDDGLIFLVLAQAK